MPIELQQGTAQSARERGKSQRRDDILRVARELMRETGDLQFSMRTLAEQAGVSIATPYNLFGSKQNILLAVLDADLREYQHTVGQLRGDDVEILFEGIRVLTALLRRDAAFYRNMLRAVSQGGPEFRLMVRGPRYVLWKQQLRRATEAGLLQADLDPDAFAIASSQLALGNLVEWAQGTVTLDEMEARSHYGLALALLAIATDRGRPSLTARLREAERRLQTLWRTGLAERLRRGDLDEETREILADQLKHLNIQTLEQAP